MDRSNTPNQQWTIPSGADVVGADGAKVGSVVDVQGTYIVVEKGFFFPTDYYIPTGAVTNFDGNTVYLNVTKDEALHQGWDTVPAGATSGSATDLGATDAALRDTGTVSGTTRETAAASGAAQGDDTLRVPVREEELTATTHPVERGAVQVTTDVVTESQQLEVPVTEERVRVERRALEREVPADADAFREGTIEVPVRGEEVQTQKRVVQTGEVEIGKEAVQRTEQVADTVRREQVRVDQSGDVVADTAGSTSQDATTTDAGRSKQAKQRRRPR